VTEANVTNLYRFAKLNFDCGRYRDAADFLYYFREFSKDEEKRFWALWGKLAAEILMANFEVAAKDLSALRDAIDKRIHSSHLATLQQRTWLLHWSLFIFFNLDNGRAMLIDFFFRTEMLNCIQTTCPHLLRYLTCAVIINKRAKKNLLKDTVRVITQEKDNYSDPVTHFLRSLYVDFNFEEAHRRLKECEQLCASDFFLVAIGDELLESARQLVFETYARTHQCLDIPLLAKALDLPKATEYEQRMVDLIRVARLNIDVKINSSSSSLHMEPRYPSVYQQIIDKTENLVSRTQAVAHEVERRITQQQEVANGTPHSTRPHV